MSRKKLLIRLVLLIFFILFLHLSASVLYWYSLIWWFDMLMHFLGGFWVGLAVVYLFPPETFSYRSIVALLPLVLLVGVGWEVFEILVDKTITENSFNGSDSLSDIFFDLAGGLTAMLYLLRNFISV